MSYKGKKFLALKRWEVLYPPGDSPVKWYWDVMIRKTKLEWKRVKRFDRK